MEIDRDRLRDIGKAASVEDRMPPRAVLRALASLTAGTVPLACAAEAIERDDSTTWRVAALTDDDIVFVEASAPIARWTFERDENNRTEPATMTAAYAIPRSRVTRVDVIETHPGEAWGQERLEVWTTLWNLRADDLEMSLPASTTRVREKSDALVQMLRGKPVI